MNSQNGYDREEQLNEMRKRTREQEAERNSEAYREKERARKFDKFRSFLVILCVVISLALFPILYLLNYEFTTYSVDASYTITSPSSADVFDFKNGNVIVAQDSVSYMVNGEYMFTTALSVPSPIFRTEGEYFTLVSNGGYKAYIFNDGGLISTIKVSRSIVGIDISASGVVALCTQSEDTAYITYYDRYGTHISVDVKTAVNISGYPVSLSVSPDGQKLCVIYYTVANGIGESRLVFYDFEHGKAEKSYVIGALEHFYDTNTFLVTCEFTDNRHVTVVGDKEFLFLTYDGIGSLTENAVKNNGTVKSVVEIGKELLVVTDEVYGTLCTRYDATGRVLNTFTAPDSYEYVTASTRHVLFRTGAHIEYYNASGKKRYSGELSEVPEFVSFFGTRSLLVGTGDGLQKITLK